MKIEAGKYYVTRDGRKVGPTEKSNSGDSGGFFISEFGLVRSDGIFGYGKVFCQDLDLVSEWKDETTTSGPTLSGDTIDHIAIDSLKWHYNEGKNDMEPLQKEAFKIVLRYYGVNL